MAEFLLILTLGTGVGWAATRARLPAAVVQVLLGVVIGPPVLGWVGPGARLELVGAAGIVLLLGAAGLHLGARRLAQGGWAGFWVALLGIAFSLLGGFAFSKWAGSPFPEAIYVGTALTATSIGISVQVLHQFGLVSRRVGRIVIAAAVVDDVIALLLLALAHGYLSGEAAPGQIIRLVVLSVLSVVAIFAVCRGLARLAGRRLFGLSAAMALAAAALLIAASAWLTERMGFSLVVGGFFAGLGIGEGLNDAERRKLHGMLEKLVFALVPFFFVLIGTRAQWNVLADPGMPAIVAGLLAVALIGKTLGGMLGALGAGDFATRLLIGLSMAPRGEVVLVIATLGFRQAHVSHHMMVALILVTVFAALAAPLLITPLARREQELRERT